MITTGEIALFDALVEAIIENVERNGAKFVRNTGGEVERVEACCLREVERNDEPGQTSVARFANDRLDDPDYTLTNDADGTRLVQHHHQDSLRPGASDIAYAIGADLKQEAPGTYLVFWDREQFKHREAVLDLFHETVKRLTGVLAPHGYQVQVDESRTTATLPVADAFFCLTAQVWPDQKVDLMVRCDSRGVEVVYLGRFPADLGRAIIDGLRKDPLGKDHIGLYTSRSGLPYVHVYSVEWERWERQP